MQLWLIKQVSMTLHDRWCGLLHFTTLLLLLFSVRDEVIVINLVPEHLEMDDSETKLITALCLWRVLPSLSAFCIAVTLIL